MFNDLYYFPFLIVSVAIYWLLPKQTIRKVYLTLCSYAVIWYFDSNALIVVISLTIFTYLISVWMIKSNNPQWIHRFGIIGLLAVLIVFKYLGFFSETLNSLVRVFKLTHPLRIQELFLPLGISYIVLKCISYLTDLLWKVVKKGRFVDLACYCSMFTIFTAGPIERFERLKPQLENSSSKLLKDDIIYAFGRIVIGLFKKFVIADWLNFFVSRVFDNLDHYSALVRVCALLGYAFQIYFDFAGYSDIAIGSSRLFGFKIAENFNRPYAANNLSQFWRRWHISLSDWIRDYLFFPLSQYKTSKFWLTICVPIIAMSLCGLWHDAAWKYVVWGLWHGIGIAVFQAWSRYAKANRIKIPEGASRSITLLFVIIGWAVFKGGIPFLLSLLHPISIVVIACFLFAYWVISKIQIPEKYTKLNMSYALILLIITFISYCSFTTGFIYGKF